MCSLSRRPHPGPLLTTLILLLPCTGARAEDSNITPDEGQTFLTRPEIQVPRWDVTIHDQERISPGYWFLAPYGKDDQSSQSGLHSPMILDQSGELVWSGAALTQGYSASDIRVSNVRGEDMLTFLYPQNRSLVVLDKHLNVFKQLELLPPDSHDEFNSHELNFVNGGNRALVLYDQSRKVGKADVADMGFPDRSCYIRDVTFKESDLLEDWRFVYRWSASKRIDFSESTATDDGNKPQCYGSENPWDWVQANSVDKFDREGDYLLSARYTNTIYRTLRDGDIAWRLGGEKSDFQADFTFSRQNHARIQSYNDTHTIISLFDNGDPTSGANSSSRGLLVALRTDTEPKTATLLAEYAHPSGAGSYLDDEGSMQVLPDGNVFSGWVEGLSISEHDAEGRLLMEARVEQQWLRSYRSYKMPFVGEPAQPPDIYVERHPSYDSKVVVYASWNGATEVAGWNVYRSTSDMRISKDDKLAYAERSGFETRIEVDGHATHVLVEAVDKDGVLLGRSNVFGTSGPSSKPGYVPAPEDIPAPEEPATAPEESIPTPHQEEAAASEETTADEGQQFEQDVDAAVDKSWKETATSRGGIASFLGFLAVAAALFLMLRWWRRRRTSWIAKHNRKPSDHELMVRHEQMYSVEDDEDDEDYRDKGSR